MSFDHDELSEAEAQERGEVEQAKQANEEADSDTQPGEETTQRSRHSKERN